MRELDCITSCETISYNHGVAEVRELVDCLASHEAISQKKGYPRRCRQLIV